MMLVYSVYLAEKKTYWKDFIDKFLVPSAALNFFENSKRNMKELTIQDFVGIWKSLPKNFISRMKNICESLLLKLYTSAPDNKTFGGDALTLAIFFKYFI